MNSDAAVAVSIASELAQPINEEHRLVRDYAGRAVEHAKRAGELLIQAKKQVGHGQWLSWLKENISFSSRTAQAYMQLARALPKLSPENAQRVALLPIREALRSFVAGTTRMARLPPSSLNKVVENVEDGMTVHRAVVRGQALKRYEAQRQLPVPAPIEISGRRVRVLRNPDKAQWAIEVQPNVSRAEFEHQIAAARQDDKYINWATDADMREWQAKELEEEAKELREMARESRSIAWARVREIVRRDGPVYAFLETVVFKSLGPAMDAELQKLPTSELADRLFGTGATFKHSICGGCSLDGSFGHPVQWALYGLGWHWFRVETYVKERKCRLELDACAGGRAARTWWHRLSGGVPSTSGSTHGRATPGAIVGAFTIRLAGGSLGTGSSRETHCACSALRKA